MLKIKIHATGSKGNAYTIQDGNQKILIDPGVKYKDLQIFTDFSIASYDFVLLSHEHKDHSRAIPELLKFGKNCYMSVGTRNALELFHSSALIAAPTLCIERDGWFVLPFDLYHDAAEPLGFLIMTPSGRKICFATDTAYIRYRFSGVGVWMIEANYSNDILSQNSNLPESVKDRIRQTHFEIERVKQFFSAQDLSRTSKIYLLHISEDNSDENLFQKEIEEITGVPVIIA